MSRTITSPSALRITHRITSLYNPVERCWGILERDFHGALLDSVDAVVQYASTMTWKGAHPVVELVTSPYQTGVKLTKEAMETVETHLQRLPLLEKWFVDIVYHASNLRGPTMDQARHPMDLPHQDDSPQQRKEC